jgi:hypothetical protein
MLARTFLHPSPLLVLILILSIPALIKAWKYLRAMIRIDPYNRIGPTV